MAKKKKKTSHCVAMEVLRRLIAADKDFLGIHRSKCRETPSNLMMDLGISTQKILIAFRWSSPRWVAGYTEANVCA
jgi:protein gp37